MTYGYIELPEDYWECSHDNIEYINVLVIMVVPNLL